LKAARETAFNLELPVVGATLVRAAFISTALVGSFFIGCRCRIFCGCSCFLNRNCFGRDFFRNDWCRFLGRFVASSERQRRGSNQET
jgi:hypothetical protein